MLSSPDGRDTTNLMFMLPRDIGLFLRSARTDATIAALRPEIGNEAAFDAVYTKGDPWASGDGRYRYQQRKYDVLSSLLPDRHYAKALDLGSGHGLLARRLSLKADEVLGIDISQVAVDQANALHSEVPNLSFLQADVLDLPSTLDGRFDLVVVADMLYYLPEPLDDRVLKHLAQRIARLLVPGGLCLLVNHYFTLADADSRLSRRIHRAFGWSADFDTVSEYRKAFYLASLLKHVGPIEA